MNDAGSDRRGPVARIVLHQPEIPNNTGTIGRTCVTYGAALTLIHPLGFSTEVKALRRAGLDYWPRLSVEESRSWGDYVEASPGARRWVLTTRASRTIYDAPTAWGDHFVFGSESCGLPDQVHDAVPAEHRLVIPILPDERSLNLANAAAVVLAEHVRRLIGCGAIQLTDGRLVYNVSARGAPSSTE